MDAVVSFFAVEVFIIRERDTQAFQLDQEFAHDGVGGGALKSFTQAGIKRYKDIQVVGIVRHGFRDGKPAAAEDIYDSADYTAGGFVAIVINIALEKTLESLAAFVPASIVMIFRQRHSLPELRRGFRRL